MDKRFWKRAIRQERRIRHLEATLPENCLDDFRQDIEEAPRYDYPIEHVWDSIRFWEAVARNQ